MNNAELGELAKQLGHAELAIVEKSNGRWYCTCSCGYESRTRTSFAECVGTLQHHLKKILAEYRATGGVSIKSSVSAGR